jgi:hypothetical protein
MSRPVPSSARAASSTARSLRAPFIATAASLTPILGFAKIPPFSSLLSLYPPTLQVLVAAIAPIIVGTIAIIISWRGLLSNHKLANKGRLIVILAFLGGVLAVSTVVAYLSVVTRISVGKSEIYVYVTGFGTRPSSCECPPVISNEECINQYTTHRSEAIATCFGDDRIRTANVVLFLLYVLTLGCLAALGAVTPWSETKHASQLYQQSVQSPKKRVLQRERERLPKLDGENKDET